MIAKYVLPRDDLMIGGQDLDVDLVAEPETLAVAFSTIAASTGTCWK